MDSIVERIPASKVLVGVSLDAGASTELLSWAVQVATPNNTIVALHVMDANVLECEKPSLRQAKAFVITMLGEFAEVCGAKKVKLEAKVRRSTSIGKGLTDEAGSIDANLLLIGGSRNSSRGNSFEITRYCFKHAPVKCSVIAVGRRVGPQHDTDSESLAYERKVGKTTVDHCISPMKRFFGSNLRGEKGHSPSESISEKSSPRAILDGPEGESGAAEDCSTPSSKEIGSVRSRTKLWRRLSIIKLWFPSLRSIEDNDICSSNNEDQKPSWRCFSYDEISRATNNFHSDYLVGRGGFAEVYRGDLSNGQSIAVKRLAKGNTDENKEREFLTELGIIVHVHHPNTAGLMGCCIEHGLHLIFNFSPNGSLASALHGNGKCLDWPARYKIAIGIARGLHYLHKCCERRIIHRDIKAANILLGDDLEPQISDFGLAKWLPWQWTHHSVIPIEGTFGYLAPEYFMHGIVDEKTDVFAFGVLLLEIVSGRKPVDYSKQSLLMWANPILESGNIAELTDPKLGGNYNSDQMRRLVLTASFCVRHSSIWRPSMSEVLQLLIDSQDSVLEESWITAGCQVDEMVECADLVDLYNPY